MFSIDPAALPQHAPEFDLRDLLEAGVHFGHQSRKWHPKMAKWIYTEKDGIHIFDLAKTAAQLQLAYNFAYDLGKNGKILVIVGTKKQAREVIKEIVPETIMTITSRWLGGLVTNWEQVSKSLRRMLDIESGLKADKFDHYTKRERVLLDKERARLERFFGGIRELKGRPDALFIIDPGREKVPVEEAQKVSVPMMALVDSNTNPEPLDIVIPGNDDAVKSIQFVTQAVVDGYQAGRNSR